MIKWDATKDEHVLIFAIAKRVFALAEASGVKYPDDLHTLAMDIEACHCNGCPLYLEGLLREAGEGDLMHDIYGIRRYIDRKTGKLEGGFTPRWAAENHKQGGKS